MKFDFIMASHKHSRLLTKEENDFVFELFPKRCLSMCTAVVELFTTEPADHSKWIKYSTGVLCYVKDSSQKSYFFRLFCLLENRLIWEQENYSNIELTKAKPYLLTFEGNNEIIAINFASENEATEFYEIASKNGQTSSRTRFTRRAPSIRKPPTVVPKARVYILRNVPKVPSQQAPIHVIKLTKKQISKSDIGKPTDFVHVVRNGLPVPSHLSEFLKKTGTENHQVEDFLKKTDDDNSGRPSSHPARPHQLPTIDSPNAPPPPVNMSSLKIAKPPPEDNRSSLLASIRVGMNLQKVNKEEICDLTEPAPASILESDAKSCLHIQNFGRSALSTALRQVLEERFVVMRSENEESDDSRADDDDWE